jgi:heptosyltransferase-2
MTERPNVLLIKLGALGDVVRTTPILRALDARVTWVTESRCAPLLPGSVACLSPEEASRGRLRAESFDLVVSMDEDPRAAALAASVKTRELVGSYEDSSGRIAYTDSARPWFDMGLLSRLGTKAADALKLKNAKTYQDLLFEMVLGRPFDGEEYLLGAGDAAPRGSAPHPVVGIEPRAGTRWPSKSWHRFEELAARLSARGLAVRILRQRETLAQYMLDIGGCDVVVSGDTLAAHLALALRKRAVSIFTCTPPQEVFGYGRMRKVVSPLLHRAFYSREYIAEAVEAVSIDQVFSAVVESAGSLRAI